jgi:hypothetical protein
MHSLLTISVAPLYIAYSLALTDSHKQSKLRMTPALRPQNIRTKWTNTLHNSLWTSSPIDLLCQADENWTDTHPYTRYGPS